MGTASVPSPVNYSPIIDEVVLQAFLRKTWDSTVRKRVLMDYMEQNKVFDDSMEHVGKYFEQRVRVGNYSGAYRNELTARNFDRKQQYVTYTVPFSRFETTSMMSEEDVTFSQNSQSAIVNLQEQLYTNLSEDLNRAMNRQLLQSNASSSAVFTVAGSGGIAAAASSPIPFFGLPTLFGHGATPLAYNPDTRSASSVSITATSKEVVTNFSYCGISTHPTNAISGVDGKVDESTSPILVNWSSTMWNTVASTTWANNCLAVLTHVQTRFSMRSSDMDDMPTVVLTTGSMWNDMAEKIRTSQVQQHVVVSNTPQSPDVGMYPRLYIPYQAVNVFPEFDQPTNVAYWINPKRMKFRIMPLQLAGMPGANIFQGKKKNWFKVGQDNDLNVGAFKIAVSLFGQLYARPDCFAAAFNFA